MRNPDRSEQAVDETTRATEKLALFAGREVPEDLLTLHGEVCRRKTEQHFQCFGGTTT
ncbi:hypothetical protein EV688_12140 [Chromatocurvus halotolerans]|uniref:Uncharacterized protein n=1 Tax=Chromatocurvus halotolerans TaxID=1132028 RepID=A0A4R2KM51_9GAMM|nr:hypothetical protein EV688_12140 [Chromatocurvus halotolerans]